ncbi:hypothetical protein H634G_01543 [Metarhizium anisopliae BRIP 53293]|uniref:NADH-ubiquinone oxidoreductase 29.9 kDa subunit n=1 Tax=Metarhizium anisopliae BRIP 53293 TaxID=1291518 RepID=A0A0D9PAY9_METAN|nr:hypothetical protein H634G_01543 [Metarhizium anisopliae BRIP 53293]
MRPTIRVLARYLEPGTPTGLAGLWTHSTPRSTLLYLYGTTLNKLQSIPETSLYRQSVEAVTKHRMGLVENIVPPGYNEWAAKAKELISKNPEQFRVASGRVDGSEARTVKLGDRVFIIGAKHEAGDIRYEEWDGEADEGGELEGIRTPAERQDQVIWAERKPLQDHEKIEWEDEPQLTAEQVQELEHKIAAGLIEEVIQVAEGELLIIDTMEKARIWEDLEERPVDGQWEYFDRKTMAQGSSLSTNLPNSINPFSRSPSERRQLSLAGLKDTDEDPTRGIECFPHRGIDRKAPEVTVSEDKSEDDADELDASETSQATAEEPERMVRSGKDKRNQRRPSLAHPFSRLDTLLRSIHQLLDQAEITKAARLFGIVLQLRPGSRPIDVRQHNIWAIGAEIIIRGGEDVTLLHRGLQHVDIESHEYTDGMLSGSKSYTRIRIPRRRHPSENLKKLKAYLGALIQKYPYDHNCHAMYASADSPTTALQLDLEEVPPQISDRYSEDVYQNDQSEMTMNVKQPGSEVNIRIQRERNQIYAREALKDISKRMDSLINELPYSKNHHFLQLRATASLLIAELLGLDNGSQQGITNEPTAAIKSEQEIASIMLQRIIDNGGHTARPLMDLMGQCSNLKKESQQHVLYASLPIRST